MDFNVYEKSDRVSDKESGVYLIKNTVNSKCYVGSSINIRKRLFWHYNSLMRGTHPNNHLQSAFNKDGKNNFKFIPILNTLPKYNTVLEQWVKDKSFYDCSYNIATDCKAPYLGKKMKKEEKIKISERNKGKIWTEEQKNYLKDILFNIKKDNPFDFKNKRLKNFKTNVFTGSNNGNSKLLEHERLDIISMINEGFRNKEIVKKYPQITSGLITEIRAGRTWKTLQNLIVK